jgi:acyl-CoA synthetase (AMP-forming)/AMP-acid ligase II
MQPDPTAAKPPSTLLACLRGAAGHIAMVEPSDGHRVSYEDLRATVEHMACQLTGLGVQPGAVVALTGSNGPEVVAAFLAIVASGAAAAPLNPAYTPDEFGAYLDDLRPSAMLFVGDTGAAARGACEAVGAAALDVPLGPLASLEIAGAVAAAERPADDPDAVALLLHTSGTTSRPKGVPLRQRNLAASATTIAAHYRLSQEDVSHCVMPLFHVHGLLASTLATFASGGTVLVPRRFGASAFWGDGADHGATWFSAVPTIHRTLLARAGEDGAEQRAQLRFARSCSSALPPTLFNEFEERFGVPLVEAYGMTEASHQMTSNPLPPAERRAGSVGLPTGTEVAVVDDDWRPLTAGEIGEVTVRGPSVIDGYRSNPEANAESFNAGWFRTGDSGHLTEDGYLVLDGRIKEIINRGGEKISPHEVENALLTHPDVVEAVAYSVPDAKYGELVNAAVVTTAPVDPNALAGHCSGQLAVFKVPARITVVDTIPKGPTGKIQRRLLADLLAP